MKEKDVSGFGECAPLPAAGTETHADVQRLLNGLSGRVFLDKGDLEALLQTLASHNPALHCGLEEALLDLESRKRGMPLRELLLPEAPDSFRVNNVAGPACKNDLAKACEQGFRVIKLKLGLRHWREEIRCVEKLSRRLPDGVTLRLDANGAWSLAQARRFLASAASLPIESIEEPLAAPSLDDLDSLQMSSSIPLTIDESYHRLEPQGLFIRAPVARLALKPMALGGLKAGMAVARRALKAGMTPIVTSTLESSIGLHALCELAAAVEALAPGNHHGLATWTWFERDLAPPPSLNKGRIHLAKLPGFGSLP